jgi:hypothetical protein
VYLYYLYENPSDNSLYDTADEEFYIWDPEAAGESLYFEANTEARLQRMVMLHVWSDSDDGFGDYYFVPGGVHGDLVLEYAGLESSSDDFGVEFTPYPY